MPANRSGRRPRVRSGDVVAQEPHGLCGAPIRRGRTHRTKIVHRAMTVEPGTQIKGFSDAEFLGNNTESGEVGEKSDETLT